MVFLKKASAFAVRIAKIITVFLKKNFEVTSTKRLKIAGLSIGFITLLGVVFRAENFLAQEFSAKWWLLIFALVCPFILMVIKCVAFIMTKCHNGVFFYDILYIRQILCHYFVCH